MTRFSNLQKWILCKACETDLLFQQTIINRYFGHRTPSIEASVSRSVWSLIGKGYVIGVAPMKIGDMALVYGLQGKSIEEFKKTYGELVNKPNEKVSSEAMKGFSKAKAIRLTDKGKEKARQLLSVK